MRRSIKRRHRNYLIMGLCSILLIMGVGYAAFSSKLDISGTSSITSIWDVEITNVVEKEKVGNANTVGLPTWDKTNANIKTTFEAPGDSITYDIISSDIIFCNNKTISNVMSGTYYNTGYGITPTIYGYERFYNWASQGKLEPTLLCPDEDSYSQTGVKGNGLLDNPVGLITADEVNMAGGMTSMVNSLYYLYTGTNYWTMSPSYFDGWFYASGMVVYSTGALNSGSTWNGYGVRPVINLDPDKLTFDGSGTMEDPWVVEAK